MKIFARAFRAGVFMLLLSLLAGCAEMPGDKSAPGVTTTVIMVRHADRLGVQDALTDAGRARAAALPAAVKEFDIAAIYSPDRVRNLETARPLAKARDIRIITVNEWDALRLMLRDNSGKTVMWVGNTNNLMEMYKELEGPGRPPVGYGDLFIVQVRSGKAAKVTERHFGK